MAIGKLAACTQCSCSRSLSQLPPLARARVLLSLWGPIPSFDTICGTQKEYGWCIQSFCSRSQPQKGSQWVKLSYLAYGKATENL